jgi:hypothetical protein
MKPKYPGLQHLTFNEADAIADALWRRFWKDHRTPVQGDASFCCDEKMLHYCMADVFHQMVREVAEDEVLR